MKKKTIEELLEQAVSEGIIEIQCPECGATITSEPDAEKLLCQESYLITRISVSALDKPSSKSTSAISSWPSVPAVWNYNFFPGALPRPASVFVASSKSK